MQYELYIDVFFLVNFVMDYLVLMTVRTFLSCTATHGRVLLGAFAGSVMTCAVICLPVSSVIKTVLLHTLVNTVMTAAGLGVRRRDLFLKAWILVYLVSFLLGGVMTWLGQYLGGYLRIGALFFALTVCSYFLMQKGLRFLETLWTIQKSRCDVTLYWKGRICRIHAVVDSGNSLYDPITGKPVHVIARKAMEKLTDKEKIQGVRFIPYCTIQNSEGVLPIVTIDKMCIHEGNDQSRENDKMVVSPLIGISGQKIFGGGTCEMILHPEDC